MEGNRPQNADEVKPPRKSRFLHGCLIGAGLVVLMVTAAVLWLVWVAGAFDKGIELMNQARYEEAEKEFLAYQSRIFWEDATCWHNIGICRARRGKMQDAKEAFRKALAIDPKQLESRRAMVACYTLEGQWKDALREVEILLEQTPDDSDARSVKQLLEMGKLIDPKGDFIKNFARQTLGVDTEQLEKEESDDEDELEEE